MTIKLDAETTGATPVRPERREAHARQDQWMAQLERAMFSSAPDTSLRQDPSPAHSPDASALAAPQLAAPAHGQALRQAARDDHAVPARDGAPRELAHAAASRSDAAAGIRNEQAAIALPAAVAMAVFKGAMPAAGMLRATPAANEPPSVSAVLATPPLRPAAQPPAPLRRAALPEAPDSAHSAPAGDARQFDKRALHLHVGADGVHAWLRDADLHHGQMNAVMQALAAEVALTGKQLTALTVNGRPFVPPGALPADGDIFSNGADKAPTSTPISHPVIKGNPAP